MNRLTAGTLAGLVATGPMTALMRILHRWPYPERDHLPPHQITSRIAARIGIKKHLSGPQFNATVVATHYGFGAVGGTVYGLLSDKVPGPPALKGALWGLVIWTMSYLGWIPAANVLPPATQHSARRNFIMIAAHLVWGITMAQLTEQLTSDDGENR